MLFNKIHFSLAKGRLRKVMKSDTSAEFLKTPTFKFEMIPWVGLGFHSRNTIKISSLKKRLGLEATLSVSQRQALPQCPLQHRPQVAFQLVLEHGTSQDAHPPGISVSPLGLHSASIHKWLYSFQPMVATLTVYFPRYLFTYADIQYSCMEMMYFLLHLYNQ